MLSIIKPSWTPISANGFHPLTHVDLATHFVEGFEERCQHYRRYMLGRLVAYLKELATLGLPMEVWLDGFFTTRCPEPADIDLVILLPYQQVPSLSHADQLRLDFLLNDRERVQIRYTCDVYHLDIDSASERQRWTQQFSANHDGSPKGIFTLII